MAINRDEAHRLAPVVTQMRVDAGRLRFFAKATGQTDPIYHALTRPESLEAEATSRSVRLAEEAGADMLKRRRAGPLKSERMIRTSRMAADTDPRTLLPLRVPERRRRLGRLVLAVEPTAPQIMAWSRWRRGHRNDFYECATGGTHAG